MTMMFARFVRWVGQIVEFVAVAICALAPIQVMAKSLGDVMASPGGGGDLPFSALTPALLGVAESPVVRGIILAAAIVAAIFGMKMRNREIVKSMVNGGLIIYFGPIALRTVAEAMSPGTLPPAPEEPTWLWALGFFGLLFAGLFLAFGPVEVIESGSRGNSPATVTRRRPPDIPEIDGIPPIDTADTPSAPQPPTVGSTPSEPEDDAVVRNKRKIVL